MNQATEVSLEFTAMIFSSDHQQQHQLQGRQQMTRFISERIFPASSWSSNMTHFSGFVIH
jgi:hypothetical protein